MVDKNPIVVKANRKNKKAFQLHRLRVFPIYQTRQIEWEDQKYTLVGQMVFQDSPLFTRFDVLDRQGKSATRQIGKQVHTYIAMLQVTSYLQMLKAPLDNQKGAVINAHMLRQNFQLIDDDEEIKKLQEINEETLESFRRLQESAAHLLDNDIWTKSNLDEFEQQWNVFWNIYESRIQPLLALYSQVENKKVTLEQEWLKAILQEAEMIYRFFSSTIPTKKPTATDINELIQTNHELGRVDQETESEIKLTAYDRMTHNVLSFLLKAVFWVILPFILLIFITEGFDFSILLFPAMVVFIYIPIFKQNEKRVRMKVMLRLEKHRNETINKQLLVNDHSKTVSSQAGVLHRYRAVEKKEQADQFEAKAISLNMASAGFFVTLISFFITIVQWWTHGWDSIAKSLLYVSIFLLAFSCWLPYSKWVRRRVVITEDTIIVGKRTINVGEIQKVVCEGNGRVIDLHIVYQKEAVQIRIEDEYQLDTEDTLKKWCKKLSVPFEEKK